MTKVNFVTRYDQWPFFRQTSGETGRWKQTEFFVNSSAYKEDWFVVYGDPPVNFTTNLPIERRILFIVEPPSVKIYSKSYLEQFGHIFTPYFLKNISQRIVQNVTQTGLPWHYGISRNDISNHQSYDDFISQHPFKKSKFCSSVISNKTITQQQILRSKTLVQLSKDIDGFDLFGNGYQHVDNKADAINDYCFHIVAENNDMENFWTEKLADAYLGWSFPLFSGGRNLEKYFPSDSFIEVNMKNSGEMRQTLKDLQNDKDFYKKRLPAIAKARDLLLNNYNVFNVIDSYIHQPLNMSLTGPQKNLITIKPDNLNIFQKIKKASHRKLLPLFCGSNR